MKLELSKVREHFKQKAAGSGTGSIERNDLRGALEDHFGDYAKTVFDLRRGNKLDSHGRTIKPVDISFAQSLSSYFNIVAPQVDENDRKMNRFQKEKWVVREFLRSMDIYTGSDTLQSCIQRFGGSHISLSELYKSIVDHSNFATIGNTNQFEPKSEWRFLFPELIMSAIRTDYEAALMSNDWIAATQSITQDEITMPHILRGNTIPRKIGEGQSIQFGTIKFGQKKAGIFKVGLGFSLTDELIQRCSLDNLFIFLGEVGNDMSICTDYEAYRVLRNGEQENGSESAPVIGVEDTNDGTTYRDFKFVTSVMKRLKRNPERIITGLNDSIDLTTLPQFQGFSGGNKLVNIKNMLGVPDSVDMDTYAVADKETMFLDPKKAMAKLKYGGMKTETRRNPQNGTEEIFVSDYVGFAILRRDARVVLDADQSREDAPLPSYMDVDARIAQAFEYETV